MKWTHIKLIALIFVLSWALDCSTYADTILYVDDDASGGNGKSWDTAYRYLQDALAEAKDASKPVQVLIAQGVYKPNQGTKQVINSPNALFSLISGVCLKGGFSGYDTPDPNERNVQLYETILSGDLLDNDVDVNDPWAVLDSPTRSDNSHNVIVCDHTDSTASIDGFTITGGHLNAISDHGGTSGGGGMLNFNSNPTIRNCVFKNNVVAEAGGAILNLNSSPIIINCTFTNNFATYGGAINNSNSSPTFRKCTFVGNRSRINGAAVHTTRGNLIIQNCVFSRNSAKDSGGALLLNGDFAKLYNCLLIGNSSKWGGGISCTYNTDVLIRNCTFSTNSATYGDSLACSSDQKQSPSKIEISNSILWDGGKEIWNSDSSEIQIHFSDIQGGPSSLEDSPIQRSTAIWGTGNISTSPLFADPNNGDYHLKSQGGRWDPISETWIMDDITSPCIDAGDPNSPIGLEPFPNGGRINMGAYGGTIEASKSYFGEPPCETIIAGDINGDCRVDFLDLAILASHWLEEYVPPNTLNTYRFLPEESSVVAYCGRGGIKNYSIEGEFRLTINPLEGEFLFYDVNAVLDEDLLYIDVEGLTSSRNLDIIFHMRDLQVIDVGETQISCVFRKGIPSYPNADVLAKVVFEGDSVSLTGTFYDIAKDRCWYQLTAKAIMN